MFFIFSEKCKFLLDLVWIFRFFQTSLFLRNSLNRAYLPRVVKNLNQQEFDCNFPLFWTKMFCMRCGNCKILFVVGGSIALLKPNCPCETPAFRAMIVHRPRKRVDRSGFWWNFQNLNPEISVINLKTKQVSTGSNWLQIDFFNLDVAPKPSTTHQLVEEQIKLKSRIIKV